MLTLIFAFFIIVYLIPFVGLFLHAFFSIYLFIVYHKSRNIVDRPLKFYGKENLPFQIIQLPVYNEDPVIVKRLIDSACKVNYQKNRLIIQLLDDSDIENISNSINTYVIDKKKFYSGLNIFYVHRLTRKEYKAGNLNYGLEIAKSYLEQNGFPDWENVIISIFDADFIIPQDYLEKTIHYFSSDSVGAIQTTLGYYNQSSCALTVAEATFLQNLHSIDFFSRSRSGHLTTFRGSAGSWRLSAIEDAGGWSGDTQVEDIDISFRAQLKGWKIVYLNHITCDSELPETYIDFKIQQRSWMKGLQEVCRKIALPVLRSKELSFSQKVFALEFFTILSLQPLFMIIVHIMVIPAYLITMKMGLEWLLRYFCLSLLIVANLTHIPFLNMKLTREQHQITDSRGIDFWVKLREKCVTLLLIPSLFITFTYGILEGFFGVKVHRDRTAKFGSPEALTNNLRRRTQDKVMSRINIAEFIMAFYSIILIFLCICYKEYVGIALFGIHAIGYSWIAFVSKHETNMYYKQHEF